MELEELIEAGRKRMSHDEVLEALRNSPEFPRWPLAMATLRAAEFAPDFLALIDAAVEGTLADSDQMLLFYGVHVLGGSRNLQAFAPLLRLLRLPPDRLRELLGDGRTMTLSRVMAGVFDGTAAGAAALCELLADLSVEEYTRVSVFGSLAFLTWKGQIDREATLAFLRRFEAESLAPPGEVSWSGWWVAVALLGARELAGRVEAAFADGRAVTDLGDYRHFADLLARAEEAPEDGTRFEDEHTGYIEDVVGAVSWVHYRQPSDEPEGVVPEEVAAYRSSFEPVRDPWRHVGRNDPCPCGSGKKAKRCCLRG